MYFSAPHMQIELYEPLRDPETEAKVEAVLASVAFWEKTITYIETEKCYQILYEIEV